MAKTLTPIPTAPTAGDVSDEGTGTRAPREPQQPRGQRRVDQILDAAEAVIAEVGVEAATTNAIAERAGSSMGSLYHFFPGGKDAIVEGLGRRYHEAMRDINARAMTREMVNLPLPELFERVVMGQAEFVQQTPAFPAVHDAIMRGRCGPGGEFAEFDTEIMKQITSFLAVRLPHVSAARREEIGLVAFVAVHSVVELSMRLPEPQKRGVLREIQRVLILSMGALENEVAG